MLESDAKELAVELAVELKKAMLALHAVPCRVAYSIRVECVARLPDGGTMTVRANRDANYNLTFEPVWFNPAPLPVPAG